MSSTLGYYRWWALLGWLLVAAVCVLSLITIEQPVQIGHGDKLSHLLAYGVLMYWWGMVQPRRRMLWVLVLPVLGLVLEWAQSLTPHRQMEWQDALANLAGVGVAWLILQTPARRLLGIFDRQLGDRFDAGRP